MKKLLLALAAIGFASLTHAGAVNVTGVVATGTTNNNPSLIADGVFPGEASAWNLSDKVWWHETTPVLTMTFDQVYTLQDVALSVDNNDYYRVEISLDNVSWTTLFAIDRTWGEIGNGMDTMSSVSGNGEYITGIDFSPAQARYARIFATGGDNSYSVGELAFDGTSVSMPEPVSTALVGLGLLGLGLARRRSLN